MASSACTLCHAQHDEDLPCPPPEAKTTGFSGYRAQLQRSNKAKTSKAFEARFPGRCPACCERIEEGDMIRYDADDDLVHEEC